MTKPKPKTDSRCYKLAARFPGYRIVIRELAARPGGVDVREVANACHALHINQASQHLSDMTNARKVLHKGYVRGHLSRWFTIPADRDAWVACTPEILPPPKVKRPPRPRGTGRGILLDGSTPAGVAVKSRGARRSGEPIYTDKTKYTDCPHSPTYARHQVKPGDVVPDVFRSLRMGRYL